MTTRLPASLIAATRNGDIVPFVGSGLSQASGMASWDRIVEVIKHRLIEATADLDTFETPDLAANTDRRGLNALLEEAVGRGFLPNRSHQLLGDIPFRTCLTTNWDVLIETALAATNRVNVIFDHVSARTWRESEARQVIKFHGSITSPESIVFGLSDYARLYLEPSILMSLARTIVATRPLLSVGFGMRDPFLKSLLSTVAAGGGPEHFVVALEGSVDRYRDQYLRDLGLTVIEVAGSSTDPHGIEGFLQELWQETYTEARTRIDRTNLLVRETERMEVYLGADRVIRARAAMGPLAVPPTNADDVFGGDDVYAVERHLLETVTGLVESGAARLRLICSPIDGGVHAATKGYTASAYRARLAAMAQWLRDLGSGVEVVVSTRPSDINEWIVGDVAMIESRKSLTMGGRLYEYAQLETNPNAVGAAVRRFDEEFFVLADRAGGPVPSTVDYVAMAESHIA